MNWHQDIIHHAKLKNVVSWATYPTFKTSIHWFTMKMVPSGAAKKLDEYVYFNSTNEIVKGHNNQHTGTLSNIDPSYNLYVDKAGSSTTMRKDKPGSYCRKGDSGPKQAKSLDLRYATMGFTAATGEPVTCIVIFTSGSQKGIPNSWLTSIDITKINNGFEIPDKIGEQKKSKCNNIRKWSQDSWRINEISTLLTYKCQKKDPAIKTLKVN
jgi:hypothetical protein